MKKGIFLFSFFFVLGIAATNAQSCQEKAAGASKACCMKADKAAYNPQLAEAIKQLSRLKYGRDVRLVESEIAERSQL